MTMHGMDVVAGRDFARSLAAASERLEAIAASVEGALARAHWDGPDAHDFRHVWRSSLRPKLTSASRTIGEAGTALARNADEQQRASTAQGAAPTPTPFGPGAGGHPAPQLAFDPLGDFADWFAGSWRSPWGLAGWALTGLGFGVDALTSSMQALKGTFAPRNALGRFVPFKGGEMSRWQQALSVGRGEFSPGGSWREAFRAQAGQASSYARWGTVSKWAGRAGVGLTALLSGAEQWNRDSGMDTGTRTARAVTAGGINAATAYAGAVGGAKAGAVLGTLIGGPGVGTAVGAVLGGLVGGIFGGFLGGKATDAVLNN